MNIASDTLRLFRIATMLWTVVFTTTAWLGITAAEVIDWSPVYVPKGPLVHITHTLSIFPNGLRGVGVLLGPALLIVLALLRLFGRTRWWITAMIWWLYVNLMNLAWLGGSGGQQLMANVLFWSILLESRLPGLRATGFWIIRMQLLLAYAMTGAHKLTGTHWIDGTAMGIVASDPAFGPRWLADLPLLSRIITWAVLVFQLTFPMAMWWRGPRHAWMLFGIAFHLGTAWWMDIPEMAFAFIAFYCIWLDGSDARRVLSPLERIGLRLKRRVHINPTPSGRKGHSRS